MTDRKILVLGASGLIGRFATARSDLTPDLSIEPRGALVKAGPAIVLMLVAPLILDNR
jgi:hypothetical protein